jgi:hypothetical protein
MANIQEIVERSIFEKLRLETLALGYIPNINNLGRYPVSGGILTKVAQANWEEDVAAIKNLKGFAIEVFSNSSSFSKGLERVPRIGIITKRITDGDIGLPPGSTIYNDPDNPNQFIKIDNPTESVNMHFDIHLVTGNAVQNRILNQILQIAFGVKRFIPVYNTLTEEKIFIKQYGHYDSPDARDGQEENVYTYEVQDLYIFDESTMRPVVPITEITTDIILGYRSEDIEDYEPKDPYKDKITTIIN